MVKANHDLSNSAQIVDKFPIISAPEILCRFVADKMDHL